MVSLRNVWTIGMLLSCAGSVGSFHISTGIGRTVWASGSSMRMMCKNFARDTLPLSFQRVRALPSALPEPCREEGESGNMAELRSAWRQYAEYQSEPTVGHGMWIFRSALAAAVTFVAPFAAVAEGGSGAQDSLVQGMFAGAIAGAAVDLVLYPLDTIKTRLQTNSMKELSMQALPGLYSGLLSSLAGHVPSSALFFAIYQTAKVYWLEPSFGEGAVSAQLLASALGNLGASIIRVPTEVVKTRLQSGGEESISACCQNILTQDGPAGFFRGYTAFLARDLPFDAIEFVSYEQFRILFLAAFATAGQLQPWQNSLLGAAAGGMTGALTTPLDTIRAQTMNQAGSRQGRSLTTSSGQGVGGVLSSARLILQTQGVAGLFAGVVPRTLWLALGGTVFFSSLEAVKSALK